MPPSISKGSIGTLARFKRPHAVNPRSFSTTASLFEIGPENPRYIEVPTTAQPQVLPSRDIKGILPPPRNLFPKTAANRMTPEYFATTTPKPKSNKKPSTEYTAWKRDMAVVRRKNLREGLQALHSRKLRTDREVARESVEKTRKREERVYAPQREDERLTNPTVLGVMTELRIGKNFDPNREARVEGKKARVAARQAVKEEARRNALHTLYMNARTFITTEELLDAEINAIFVDRPWEGHNVNDALATNIWDGTGQPPSVQDMLSTINGTQSVAVERHAGPTIITGRRMQKIAEELTGGKMD